MWLLGLKPMRRAKLKRLIHSKALGAWYVKFGIHLYISKSYQIALILVKQSLTHLSTIRIEDHRHLHVWRHRNFPLRCSKHLKLYNVHNSLGNWRRNRIQDCCWDNQKLIENKRKEEKMQENSWSWIIFFWLIML